MKKINMGELIMKRRIIALLVSIFIIGCLPISNVAALSTEDKPYFYDVQIDKKGEILGDGDTINVSCKLAKCDIVVDDCICWINAYSSHIYFPLYYNEATGRYEGSYTFGETYDNPQRACYIMIIESYKNKITTYCNAGTHPLGMHEFYYCNKCKDGIHYPVIDEAKGSTCAAEGMTEGSHCSLCSTVIKVQETIPAKGHTWDNGKVIKEATCKEEGVKTYTCTICKEAKTEAIAELSSHTPGPEATATMDQVCTICGKVLVKATGETQSSEKPTEPATQPTEPAPPPATDPVTPPATNPVTPPATEPTTESTTEATAGATNDPTTESVNQPTETTPDKAETPDGKNAFPIILVSVVIALTAGGTGAFLLFKRKKG